MSAIVRSNTSLSNGGIVLIRRSLTTSDDGTMTYAADYACLSQYATKWTPFFRTRAQPPTPLPADMLQLNLTKVPELYDLTTETMHGLTYFKAVYSAGVSTEVIITEDSDVRNFTVTITRDVGYSITTPFTTNGSTSFFKTGEETITQSYDYISVTVTASSKNASLPNVKGRVEPIGFLPYAFTASTIDRSSKSRTSRGEYTYSKSSSGVMENITTTGLKRTIN